MKYKRIIQSGFFFLLGTYVLFNFYKDFSFEEFQAGIEQSKLHWILLATVVHLVNHFFRAVRWKALMGKSGRSIGMLYYVIAEMTGFFTSLFIPRFGEWMRCSTLKRMSGLPIKVSFPTVIAEKSIDILVFLGIFFVVFLRSFLFDGGAEQKVLLLFFEGIVSLLTFSLKHMMMLLGGLVIGSGVLLYVYYRFRDYMQYYIDVVVQVIYDTKDALRKAPMTTWLPTLFIWIAYFLVEYISCFALQATSGLSLSAVLCVFVMINFGIAIPIPGNIGAYHMLMYGTLKMFDVPHESAIIYVTITHGIQVFNALVIGGICTISGRLIRTDSVGKIPPRR